MLGEYSYGGTPSYIPNLEVKPIYADGTWGGRGGRVFFQNKYY